MDDLLLALLWLLVGIILAVIAMGWRLQPRIHQLQADLGSSRAQADHLQGELERVRAEGQRQLNELEQARRELTELQVERAQLRVAAERDRAAFEDRFRELAEMRASLAETFRALSGDVLRANRDDFLALAQTSFQRLLAEGQGALAQRQQAIQAVIEPVGASLLRFDEKITSLERLRATQQAEAREQIQGLFQAQERLRQETQQLVQALRTPQVRGQWGELHLRRAFELAGLSEQVDFDLQVSVRDGDANLLRPDALVHLPSERCLVIDCKTPLEAYLQALSAETPEARNQHLGRHATHVRTHVEQLAGKAYWKQFAATAPDFVVLFLPSEAIFSAALSEDPGLIEFGASRRVVLATPTTLIALLRVVAHGWRQARLADEAQAISSHARDLYDRVGTLVGHFAKLGNRLNQSVEAYNQVLGSFESRVAPAGKRLAHLAPDKTWSTPAALHQITAPAPSPEAERADD